MTDTLSTISMISFILCGVFLLAAIVIFIRFKIPTVIKDLSGRTARKSIAQLRAANEKTGHKAFAPSTTNSARGTVTETMPGIAPSAKKEKPPKSAAKKANERPETVPPRKSTAEAVGAEETAWLSDDPAATEMLNTGEETMPLDDGTTELLSGSQETALLSDDAEAALGMLDEEIIIHTEETI